MQIQSCFRNQLSEFHFPIILEMMKRDYKGENQPFSDEKINPTFLLPFEFRLFCPYVLANRDVMGGKRTNNSQTNKPNKRPSHSLDCGKNQNRGPKEPDSTAGTDRRPASACRCKECAGHWVTGIFQLFQLLYLNLYLKISSNLFPTLLKNDSVAASGQTCDQTQRWETARCPRGSGGRTDWPRVAGARGAVRTGRREGPRAPQGASGQTPDRP